MRDLQDLRNSVADILVQIDDLIKAGPKTRKAYRKKTVEATPPQADEIDFAIFLSLLLSKWSYNLSGHGSRRALAERSETDFSEGWLPQAITEADVQKWRRINAVPLWAYNYLAGIKAFAPRHLNQIRQHNERRLVSQEAVNVMSVPPYRGIAA